MWLLLACSSGADTAPEGGEGEAVVVVQGPDIDIEPWLVEVGSLSAGEVVNASLTISNLGSEDLELSAMSLETSVAGLDEELLPVPLYIVPGSDLTMLFQVGPSDAGAHTGRYAVRSNDPDEPLVTVEVQWTVSGG